MGITFLEVHLKFFNDVPIVRTASGLLAWSVARTAPPVFGRSLHHVGMDLKRQSIDLAVQVHWDGYRPRLSCSKKIRQREHCIREIFHFCELENGLEQSSSITAIALTNIC